jgi:hypothetical protein
MWIDLLCIGIVFLLLMYIGSRLQMKAWLKELDLHLGKKFVDYINSKKEKNGTEEKK